MNRIDEILQSYFPTVMVPKHEELVPCEKGKSRFLMAKYGLYIESKQPFIRLVKQLWLSRRSLPYGHIEEVDTLKISEIMPIIEQWAVPQAYEYSKKEKEWAGWIVYENGLFKPLELDFSSSAAHVSVNHPKLAESGCLAVDVHSHEKMAPFFSSTDNKDDRGGVKISAVLGGFEDKDEGYSYNIMMRYCIEGFFFTINEEDYEEPTDFKTHGR